MSLARTGAAPLVLRTRSNSASRGSRRRVAAGDGSRPAIRPDVPGRSGRRRPPQSFLHPDPGAQSFAARPTRQSATRTIPVPMDCGTVRAIAGRRMPPSRPRAIRAPGEAPGLAGQAMLRLCPSVPDAGLHALPLRTGRPGYIELPVPGSTPAPFLGRAPVAGQLVDLTEQAASQLITARPRP